MLSPAAYFVDLLQFVKNAKLDGRLMGRRSDLQDVELSCNNTNTEAPAIDLALEVLESAVALPLNVDLSPGTKVIDQLIGPNVGPDVWKALKQTVRTLPPQVEVRATQEDADWTVVDGHRRWKLTAQPEDAVRVNPVSKEDTAALNLPEVIAALDQRSVASVAETTFAHLFAPNQKNPDYADYAVTITPGADPHSWVVTYHFEAVLLIDTNSNQLTLQTREGQAWSEKSVKYSEKTIKEARSDLSKNAVPVLAQQLVAPRFPNTGKLSVKASESGPAGAWTIKSDELKLTLSFTPAQLSITSLTYQSGDPDADAIAEPENHNPAAYEKLNSKDTVFPWSLPVDLPLEEVRLFLDRARSSRRRLIESMIPINQALGGSAVFALEVLGLSEAEAKLIAPQSPPSGPDVYPYWGVSSNQMAIWDAAAGGPLKNKPGQAPLALLQNVSILLQQSRLSFEELQAVLAMRFVEPDATVLRIEPETTCKPSEMTVDALTTGHLDRLHRFTRLWRKLGWTMREVDLAIQAFGGQLTPDTLIGLACLKRLQQQLDLPVASLVGGLYQLETQPWAEYFTGGQTINPSLYATIFQREALRSVSDFADFALLTQGTELKNTPALGISAHASYIGACLGIKPSAVADWVSGTDGLGIVDKLDLANLSRLAAAAGLCRALGIDPEKLSQYPKLDDASIFLFQPLMGTLARAEAMLQFVERFRAVQGSGVDVETLRYLLQLPHENPPVANADLDEKQLADLADAVLHAIQSIPGAPQKLPPLTAADRLENDQIAQATHAARENAAIAVLATGLGVARELVEHLLRVRLRKPSDASTAAIDVFFSPLGDFIDLKGLLGKLRISSDPLSVSAYLWNGFSANDRLVLTDLASTALQQQTTLVAALNKVLQGPSIYEDARFHGVDLSAETLALKSGSPAGRRDDLTRLNRLLLEDAYPQEIAKRLLSDMLFVASGVPQVDGDAANSVLVRLYKSALLCAALKLGRTDLSLLPTSATDPTGFIALDFNTLPVTKNDGAVSIKGFDQLLALSKLRVLTSNASDLLHQYAALSFAAVAALVPNAQQVLADGLVVDSSEVGQAAQHLNITTAGQYRDPISLTRLIELLASLKKLGASVDHVRPQTPSTQGDPNGLTAPSPNDADAGIARQLLHGKYGASQWRDLIKPISDKLRERQRDALVDYLIDRGDDANPQIYTGVRLRNADDLYEHYLIDVQTGSCLKTTRLLQATAAVQLFVQRVFLNLEKDASLGDDKSQLWDWMHNYRVWEANRKVFLFPENWLLPELRDDKTAIFREMEGALTQQEPSTESTRDALLGYLDDLGELAQISVIAMYEDYRTVGTNKPEVERTLQVIGRTPNQPYHYFWRSCAQFGDAGMSWSGWETLDLDNANDFIMPFVFEGDLHVAWPIFRQTSVDTNATPPSSPILFWEVQIAWTRRTSQGWAKRKLSYEVLTVPRLFAIPELRSFVFKLRKSASAMTLAPKLTNEYIIIDCYAAVTDGQTPFEPKTTLISKTNNVAPTSDNLPPPDLGWRNVYLTVSGQVCEHYTLTQGSVTEDIYQPVVGVIVTLDFEINNDVAGSRLGFLPCITGLDGTFSFSQFAVANASGGGKVTLKCDRQDKNKSSPKLICTLGDYQHWEWDTLLVIEIDKPATTPFDADRPVSLAAVGGFMLELTHDMHVLRSSGAPELVDLEPTGMQRLGNRFMSTSGGKVVGLSGEGSSAVRFSGDGILWVDDELGPQFETTPATVGETAAAEYYKPRPWHVRDATGRYYARRKSTRLIDWKVWPDGQDFVGWYRGIAAASTFALLDPATQAMTRDGQLLLSPGLCTQPPFRAMPPLG